MKESKKPHVKVNRTDINVETSKTHYKLISILLGIFILIIILNIPIETVKSEKYTVTEYKEEIVTYLENESYYINETYLTNITEYKEGIELKEHCVDKTSYLGTLSDNGISRGSSVTITCSVRNKDTETYNFEVRIYISDSMYFSDYDSPILTETISVPAGKTKTVTYKGTTSNDYYLCEMDPLPTTFCEYRNETIKIPYDKEVYLVREIEKIREVEKNRTISVPYDVEKEKNVTIEKPIISYFGFETEEENEEMDYCSTSGMSSDYYIQHNCLK